MDKHLKLFPYIVSSTSHPLGDESGFPVNMFSTAVSSCNEPVPKDL
jgi:hypothetical protein